MLNKIAAGYIRCSTETQDDSPDQQRKEIEAFAAKKGYNITEWFTDFGVSGTTYDRVEFQRLWKIVENGAPFKAVICYDESRWGRAINSEDNTYWRVAFRKHGVVVVLVKTSVDPQNEFAPMFSTLEGIQASQYSKKLSELTLRGAANNACYSNGGTAPYGYVRMAINQKSGESRPLRDGEWCVSGQEKVKFALGDPNEIEIVRTIFSKRAQGISLTLIAKELNDRTIPCPKRGRWKNYDRKWAAITIKTIIENPTYYGAWTYNRNSMSRIRASREGRPGKEHIKYPHWKNPREDWQITEGAYTPIVTKDIWLQANSVNGQRGIRSTHRHNAPYLLSGVTRCTRCGFAYQGQSTKTGARRYHRYVCGGYNGKRVCNYFAVNRDLLEGFAIRAVRTTITDPQFLRNVVSSLQSLVDAYPHETSTRIKTIGEKLTEIGEKEQNLVRAIESGIGLDTIQSRLGDLKAEKIRLEREARQVEVEQINQTEILNAEKAVRDFVADFEQRFADGSLPLKKQIVKQCVRSIEIDPENRLARCYVRLIPPVTNKLLGIQAELEENEKAPQIEAPFRKAGVAGGRTFF